MSVIRQPDVLGRATRRRVVGTTAAVFTTTIEAIAVGTWFLLVVLETRTVAAALAGVGILFCGSLVRASVFGIATNELDAVIRPLRLGIVVFGSAGWVLWLLTAEWLGGTDGVLGAGMVLLVVLVVQFGLERRLFQRRSGDSSALSSRSTLVPATLITIGASSLLYSVWLTDWATSLSTVALEGTRFVIRLEAVQVGFAVFAIVMFLAHQQRLRMSLRH